MKLVTFKGAAGPTLGVLVDGEKSILDVQAAHSRKSGSPSPMLASMQALIEAEDKGLDAIRALVAADDGADHTPYRDEVLLAPLRPVQMRDCLCFEQHLINAVDGRNKAEGRTERTKEQQARLDLFASRPFWYKCNRFAVTGTGTVVNWPAYSKHMDYEMEMGIILWRGGVNLSPEEASKLIFGYTVFNDFSARDTQPDEMATLGPSRSKDFDNGNVLGPCIVTADEFDRSAARMISRVNGEIQNDGAVTSMSPSVEELISFISQSQTLYPGEMLGSGTVGGGCGLELGKKLNSGDVVELEITGIGKIRNQVIAS